ncbi:ABC transporter substrate-binding protein [Pseudohalocynthiibacter sp. F2068]|jgi:NitT/TauT family transport system substrate-binding protein|uniref:ABC transporter substrate-binding protein n=1 Tax=Pseudohalocynthiibacter sp. F2068 TaxID=2926418 RepID=UPI001FF45D22|nr:ABC transporter substrate-binding protein [Pseudohalocynthiibacter sp. F2068]MCK0100681.1 ABC transporter substrate-binding protein [Pseudohalocynthiibacter sp. F2068]
MITLYENLRTIVYAPFYLADRRGYWADQGLEVNIQLSPDPVETAEGLLAGRADISWGGPMRVLLHHDRDPDCPLVAFGQIVARDPFVLIGRAANPRFRFEDLQSGRLAVATEVPTPWMTFQDDLTRAGVDPASLDITPKAPMKTAPARLAAGEIDVAQVLEPYASAAVAEGSAHIWHRFANRGDIGYTSFYTKRGYLEAHPETCAALLAGIAPALSAMASEPASEIAAELAELFPDVPQTVLTSVIAGYQASNLWARETDLPPAAFVRLKAALLSGGLISRDIPYDHVIARLEKP